MVGTEDELGCLSAARVRRCNLTPAYLMPALFWICRPRVFKMSECSIQESRGRSDLRKFLNIIAAFCDLPTAPFPRWNEQVH